MISLKDKQINLQKLKSLHPVLPKPVDQVTLHIKENKVNLPVMTGTDGKKLIDIQSLYAKGGVFCYDPGYMYTGSCLSSITNLTD